MTKDRVERLLADLSARSRTETAAIVATELASGQLSEAERRIALDIVAVLAQDALEAVREALAEHLKSCPFLPRNLALTLAHDVATVAVPILRYSSVLRDEDLIAIIRGGNVAKQVAIAGRETVTEPVSDALVSTCDRAVVKATLANPGARLGEGAMQRVVDQFAQDTSIQKLLIDRPSLPLAVAQRLVECAADELRAQLMLRHRLPGPMFEELMMHGRDRALAVMIGTVPDAKVEALARSLSERGMLPPLLLLRCLCEGAGHFFDAGLAVLAGLPLDRARALIDDQGALGFQAIYRRAGLPDLLLPAFKAAVGVRRERGALGGPEAARLVLERIRDHYPGIRAADLEQAMAQLWRVLAPEAIEPSSAASA
ncbi:MAG: DUF2336 domain-containing protein [Alphaproteobacteria bacterium]